MRIHVLIRTAIAAAVFSVLIMQPAKAGNLPALRVSDNGRFLVTEDGKPFFWLGDTAWAVVQKYTREQTDNQPSVLEFFKSRASKGFNVIQTTSHFVFTNYKTVGADYAKKPVKPTLEAEVAYEYSVDLGRQKELDKRIQPWHVRKAAYWSVFAGGFGFTYGHRSYILWVRAGESLKYGADIPWFESLDAPGAFDMTHLRDLMESRPFLTRVPDQAIVAKGPADKLNYVAATRSSDGSYVMLYFPTGKPVIVRMDKISGAKVQAWWFDPREGKAEEIGIFPNSGTKRFTPPSSGRDNDWVLVLDDAARGFPPPGSVGWGLPHRKNAMVGQARVEGVSPLKRGQSLSRACRGNARDTMEGQGQPYSPPPDSEGGWRTLIDPEEIRRVTGLDVRKMDEAFDIAEASTKNGGLLVVRHGWLIYERYFGRGHREATPNLASCGKSFTSIAIGILMAERPELFPDGLDQKVFTPKYLPPKAFPLSDPAMADIKLGQLLAFSAGIRGNNPGFVKGKPTECEPLVPDVDGWWHEGTGTNGPARPELPSGG